MLSRVRIGMQHSLHVPRQPRHVASIVARVSCVRGHSRLGIRLLETLSSLSAAPYSLVNSLSWDSCFNSTFAQFAPCRRCRRSWHALKSMKLPQYHYSSDIIACAWRSTYEGDVVGYWYWITARILRVRTIVHKLRERGGIGRHMRGQGKKGYGGMSDGEFTKELQFFQRRFSQVSIEPCRLTATCSTVPCHAYIPVGWDAILSPTLRHCNTSTSVIFTPLRLAAESPLSALRGKGITISGSDYDDSTLAFSRLAGCHQL